MQYLYEPVFVRVVDLPVLSFFCRLPFSFAFFHFCQFDAEDAPSSVALGHLKHLWTRLQCEGDLGFQDLTPLYSFVT